MKKHSLATGIIAAVVLGAGTFAWAEYQPSDPAVSAQTAQVADFAVATPGATPGATPNAANPSGHARRRHNGRFLRHRAEGFLGRAVHGSVIVKGKDGTWQTVDFDKGKLTKSADGSTVTVARPDGHSVTLRVTPDTKFRGIDGVGTLRADKPGLVVSKDGKAIMIAQRDGNSQGRPGVHAGEGQVPAA